MYFFGKKIICLKSIIIIFLCYEISIYKLIFI